jgi:hypothetical protein
MFEVVSQLLIYPRVHLCANLLWSDLEGSIIEEYPLPPV